MKDQNHCNIMGTDSNFAFNNTHSQHSEWTEHSYVKQGSSCKRAQIVKQQMCYYPKHPIPTEMVFQSKQLVSEL